MLTSITSIFNRSHASPLSIALAASCFALAGCGGSGTGAQSSGGSYLAGTAAYGAPMARAQVEVLDAQGKTAAAEADDNGDYQVAVDGFKAPLLVTASAASGEAVRTYRAISESAPAAGTTERVNVTPLTDAVVALASSDGVSPEEFSDPSGSALAKLDRSKLHAAHSSVKSSIQVFAQEAGQPGFDPLKSSFKADSVSPGDRILDAVRVSMSSEGVRIDAVSGLGDSLTDPTTANAHTAANIQTIANIVTTTSLAQIRFLPAGPWDLLPYPKPADLTPMLKNWAAQLNACLALPPEKRVMLDSSNRPVALLDKCKALLSTSKAVFAGDFYLHDGYSFLQLWGARLRNEIPKGAKLDAPQVIGFYTQQDTRNLPALSVPPVGTQQLVVRLSWSAPNSAGSYFETADRTGNTTWQIHGNQQEFDAAVSAIATREEDASINGFVPKTGPDAGKDVGFFNAYGSRLGLRFNANGPNAADVFAVRVTGPGLPATGVVLARSTSCGTADYLAILNTNGVIPALPTTPGMPMPANIAASTYTLAVTPLSSTQRGYSGQDFFNEYRGRNADGTPSTSPTNRTANPPVNVATIPLFAQYTFEAFKVPTSGTFLSPGGVSGTQSTKFTTRLLTRPLDPKLAAKLPWAKFSDAARQYLLPQGQFAVEQTSATLNWTTPKGAPPVRSAYLLGSGADSAGIYRRTIWDDTVKTPGGTSIALSGATEKNGNNQSCDFDKMPSFLGAYDTREIAARQSGVDGLVILGSVFAYRRQP